MSSRELGQIKRLAEKIVGSSNGNREIIEAVNDLMTSVSMLRVDYETAMEKLHLYELNYGRSVSEKYDRYQDRE